MFVLVSRLAERRPLLLVLDDAHWCDKPSLELLAYLQRRLTSHGVGLVISTRPPAQAFERALLERITAAPDTDVQILAALTVDSVAALVRRQAFPEAGRRFCQTCWEVTAGNPFYLHELLIELRIRGIDPHGSSTQELSRVTPPSVLRAVLLRLDRLPGETATLARAAAVLGDGTTLRHAAALAGTRRDAGRARRWTGWRGAELLAPGEPLRFLHPLVRPRSTDIPAARRASDHGAPPACWRLTSWRPTSWRCTCCTRRGPPTVKRWPPCERLLSAPARRAPRSRPSTICAALWRNPPSGSALSCS